jgi:hypothetical protein
MARPKRMNYWKGRNVLYRMYDATGRLVYVGSTNNVPRRMTEHRLQAWWMAIVTKTRLQVFPTLEAARAAEAVAIQEEQPAANVVGTGRTARDKSFPLLTAADRRLAREFRLRGAVAA